MATLNCCAGNCTYNQEDCCCKGDIMVSGRHAGASDDTCCDSFCEKRGDSYTSSLSHPCETISIDCEASNCEFNSAYKCHADHVSIKGTGACTCRETACATFQEKR